MTAITMAQTAITPRGTFNTHFSSAPSRPKRQYKKSSEAENVIHV